MNNAEKLNAWFDRFDRKFDAAVPGIIAETAVSYYKESFTKKGWDGKAWPATKRPVKKGSLMVRSSKLVNSIRPSLISPTRVTISAGSSKVPYARIHNEGGTINRSARSELFERNRYKTGAKSKAFGGMGLYKKGIVTSRNGNLVKGLSFKAYSYNMPQRQYMGYSAILNKRIIQRLKTIF